MKEVIEN